MSRSRSSSGAVFKRLEEAPKSNMNERLEKAASLYISLRQETSYESKPPDEVYSVATESKMSDGKARAISEIVLRAVHNHDSVLLDRLRTEFKESDDFSRLIEKFVAEAERIKNRPTTITFKKHEEKKSERKEQQSAFDAGDMYTPILQAQDKEKDITYHIDHRSLSLIEIAAKHEGIPLRMAGLEILPQQSKQDIRHLVFEPTLPSSAARDYLLIATTETKPDLSKLTRIAELNHNTPVLLKQIVLNEKKEEVATYHIFGPPQKTSETKMADSDSPTSWKLTQFTESLEELATLFKDIGKYNTEYLCRDNEIPESIYASISKISDTTKHEAAKEKVTAALNIYGEKSLIASPGMSGIVHADALDKHKLIAQGDYNRIYLERSGQMYLQDMKEDTLVAGISGYFSNHKLTGFADRSTMNYSFHSLNSIADICYIFNNIGMSDYDKEKMHFQSNRDYTFSVVKLARALDDKHKQDLLSGLTGLLHERNHIIESPDYHKQDCSTNTKPLEQWEQIRHDPKKIKEKLERTIYIACGLQKQDISGRFWTQLTDQAIIAECLSIAAKYHIQLDLNKIPGEFKSTSMSALMLAATKGDIDIVRDLVLNGADIEKDLDALKELKSIDKQTLSLLRAIHAAHKNNISVFKQIIEEFKETEDILDIQEILKEMLSNAVTHKSTDIANYIIAEYNQFYPPIDRTIYINAIMQSAVHAGLETYQYWKNTFEIKEDHTYYLPAAAAAGQLELAKYLLKNNPNNPLISNAFSAAIKNSQKNMQELLVDFAIKNLKNPIEIYELLCIAARSGNMALITPLLDHLPGLKDTPDDGNQALLNAVKGNYPNVVNALIEKNATPDVKQSFDAFQCAFQTKNNDIMRLLIKGLESNEIQSLMEKISPFLSYDTIKFFLDSGMDPNIIFTIKSAHSSHEIPLSHHVMQHPFTKDTKFIELLLDYKANLDIEYDNESLLFTALKSDTFNFQTIKLLIDRGVSRPEDLIRGSDDDIYLNCILAIANNSYSELQKILSEWHSSSSDHEKHHALIEVLIDKCEENGISTGYIDLLKSEQIKLSELLESDTEEIEKKPPQLRELFESDEDNDEEQEPPRPSGPR